MSVTYVLDESEIRSRLTHNGEPARVRPLIDDHSQAFDTRRVATPHHVGVVGEGS